MIDRQFNRDEFRYWVSRLLNSANEELRLDQIAAKEVMQRTDELTELLKSEYFVPRDLLKLMFDASSGLSNCIDHFRYDKEEAEHVVQHCRLNFELVIFGRSRSEIVPGKPRIV